MKSLMAFALTSYLLDEVKPVSSAVWRELRPLIAGGMEPTELCYWSDKNLDGEDAAHVRSCVECLSSIEQALQDLGELAIGGISEFDVEYPSAWLNNLKDKHPATLFSAGNSALLQRASLGVVGSRELDREGSEFAQAIAEGAVSLGYAVISGGARGADELAMRGAYDSGGDSIGVLSDSLARTVRSSEMQEILESGRVCLTSPYLPSIGFQVANAMARNKLIYAHAKATVVIASSFGTGGTWSGATEAMKKGYGRVLVRDEPGAPPGNRKLVELGGEPITSPLDLENALGRICLPTTLF